MSFYKVTYKQRNGALKSMTVDAKNAQAAKDLAARRGAAQYGNTIISARKDG